ncbi:hypothetical protein [Parafrankia sp. EAN1pec]|uniref:hypothetical protein n=1 Tax=Parafrankia sp. (strain EAN1pec) TaxID=298653 RepID=UPI00321C2CE4
MFGRLGDMFGKRRLLLVALAMLVVGSLLAALTDNIALLIGTSSYVQAPETSGYGFGSSMVVGGLVLLPGALGMLFLAPVSARLVAMRGAGQTLALGRSSSPSDGWRGSPSPGPCRRSSRVRRWSASGRASATRRCRH